MLLQFFLRLNEFPEKITTFFPKKGRAGGSKVVRKFSGNYPFWIRQASLRLMMKMMIVMRIMIMMMLIIIFLLARQNGLGRLALP